MPDFDSGASQTREAHSTPTPTPCRARAAGARGDRLPGRPLPREASPPHTAAARRPEAGPERSRLAVLGLGRGGGPPWGPARQLDSRLAERGKHLESIMCSTNQCAKAKQSPVSRARLGFFPFPNRKHAWPFPYGSQPRGATGRPWGRRRSLPSKDAVPGL